MGRDCTPRTMPLLANRRGRLTSMASSQGRTILVTARLTLRQLTEDDVDGLHEAFGDPIAMEHYPAPKTRDETLGWIRWARESYTRNGFGLWAVIRTADGAFLGDCGPMLQPVEGELVPEIGYHVVRREWGHGYATEAAAADHAGVGDRVHRDRRAGRGYAPVDPAPQAEPRRAPASPRAWPGGWHPRCRGL